MNETTNYPTAAEAILAFWKARMVFPGESSVFTADQLRFFVNNNLRKAVSPSTADRVLRNLRAQKKLDYIVLNRGRSLYRAMSIGTTTPATPKNADGGYMSLAQRVDRALDGK